MASRTFLEEQKKELEFQLAEVNQELEGIQEQEDMERLNEISEQLCMFAQDPAVNKHCDDDTINKIHEAMKAIDRVYINNNY